MNRPRDASQRGISWVLWRRIALRHWIGEPRQTLLLVVILALGVAVFLSVRLANRAAVASFRNFTDTLSGRSDWVVKAPAGTLPDSVLAEMRAGLGTLPVHLVAVAECTGALPEGRQADWGRATYTLVGVDLVALGNLPHRGEPSTGLLTGAKEGLWGVLRGRPAGFISPALAVRAGTPPGARLALNVNGTVSELEVAGLLPASQDGTEVPENLIVMDLPALQSLAGRAGRIDRVELLVEPGADAQATRAALPALVERIGRGRWSVAAPGARREAAETMTQAFRLNLTVLSLIALLVGLYLILQALDGAVVRRRPEIAILRSMGVEESTIRRGWLAEAALLGLAGGVVGILLGWAGAQLAVRLVGQTVNALYYATTVRQATLEPLEAAASVCLSVVASVAAGWLPAREAARTPPAQVLVRHAADFEGQAILRNYGLAAALVAAGVGLSRLPPVALAGHGRFALAGYAAAFLWIAGGGILCTLGLPVVAATGRVFGAHWAGARLAASHLARPSGRHRLVVASLLCSIGMTAGMAILVSSFEVTVRGWVSRTVRADLFVSSDGSQSASSKNALPEPLWSEIIQQPGVLESNVLETVPIEVAGAQTQLAGTGLGLLRSHDSLSWVQKPLDEAVFEAGSNRGLALASESFSERFGLARGDVVTIPTPSGPRTLAIAGVFADYGNERGSLMIERKDLAEWFGDTFATHIALYVKPGVDPDALRGELLRRWPGLAVYTNARLRAEILRIFRQTFSITYALEAIGVVVAVLGLALTLSSVLLDRREELSTLRALGLTRGEIAVATALEGLALAACACLGGTLVSLALGWLLIHVINKQSFGWTLAFEVPWLQLGGLAATVALCGAAVAYAVGRWGAVLPADREE